MKILSIIALILLVIADIVLICMVIKGFRYCIRYTPEEFALFLAGGLLLLSVTLYFTFDFACCIVFN